MAQSATAKSDSAGNVMRMTVYFQGEEWDALQAKAEKGNTSEANIVRAAVRKHLNLK